MKTIDEWANSVDGKQFDVDGAYGVQCVDGIKKFSLDMVGKSDFTCGNGWAYGLWTLYGSNGVEKYFNKHSLEEAKKGDWVIWNKNSKSCPYSHVGMYVSINGDKIKTFGQNQNGIKSFNYLDINKSGVLGVLRLKELEGKDTDTSTNVLGIRGYIKLGDESVFIGKVSKFMYKTFPKYTNKKALGNLYGPYLQASIKEFQKRAKQDKQYDDKVDGYLGPKTLKALEYYGFVY